MLTKSDVCARFSLSQQSSSCQSTRAPPKSQQPTSAQVQPTLKSLAFSVSTEGPMRQCASWSSWRRRRREPKRSIGLSVRPAFEALRRVCRVFALCSVSPSSQHGGHASGKHLQHLLLLRQPGSKHGMGRRSPAHTRSLLQIMRHMKNAAIVENQIQNQMDNEMELGLMASSNNQRGYLWSSCAALLATTIILPIA